MNHNKLNILFVQEIPCIRNYKMAKALKSKGHSISLAYKKAKLSDLYNLDDDVYDELIYIDNYKLLWDISKFYDIIHCHNEPDVLTVNCLAGDCPVIHDCHDLVSLREPINTGLKNIEGIANRGAHGRIYVSELQMKEANKLYDIDLDTSIVIHNYILRGSILPFKIPYCNPPKNYEEYLSRVKTFEHKIPNLSKLSNTEGEIHIVYEGGISPCSERHRSFYQSFKKITDNKIHIHIYPVLYDEKYELESLKNPCFHYYQPVSPDKIIQELGKYDFGIIPFIKSNHNSRHLDTMLPHKLFEYLSAGLIILTTDLESIKIFLNKNKIPHYVYTDVEELTEEKLKNLMCELSFYIGHYCIEDEIDRLIKLYNDMIAIHSVDKADTLSWWQDNKKKHLRLAQSKSSRISEFYKGIDVSEKTYDLAKNRIDKIISVIEGDVLDIGCGDGIIPLLAGRKGYHSIGIDIVQQVINSAKIELLNEPEEVRKRVGYFNMWAEDLSFKDNTFDTIILGEVLEHVMDLEITIKEARRVLKPNGKIIVTVPDGDVNVSTHLRIFDLDSLKREMNKYFEALEIYSDGEYFIWYIGKIK